MESRRVKLRLAERWPTFTELFRISKRWFGLSHFPNGGSQRPDIDFERIVRSSSSYFWSLFLDYVKKGPNFQRKEKPTCQKATPATSSRRGFSLDTLTAVEKSAKKLNQVFCVWPIHRRFISNQNLPNLRIPCWLMSKLSDRTSRCAMFCVDR